MRKQTSSKLDPYSDRLDQWLTAKPSGDGKTLEEAVAQLKLDGCSISRSRLGEWWEAREESKREAGLLGRIASGARLCAGVEEAFEKNPSPEIKTLIALHRVLIMNLSTKGVADPEMLKLADQLTNTVLNFLSAQTKAAHKEREVTLAETKAAEAKKDDGTKALEFALSESKGTPAEDLFRQAFAALKKARAQ